MTWRVVHLDLSREAPPVDPAEGHAFIVFWWGSLPLGAEAFVPEELPLSQDQILTLAGRFAAKQLAARGPSLGGVPEAGRDGRVELEPTLADIRACRGASAVLDALAADPQTPADDVSVIVCTRGRPKLLRSCLAALDAQRAPPGEIIVVDNSESGDAQVVSAHFRRVRHLHEKRPGLSVARNTGVAAATRPIIAFTDDDVEVDPGWTGQVARAFASAPEADAITGLVLPASLSTPAQRFYELQLGGFGTGYVPVRFGSRFRSEGLNHGLQVWRLGAGANMAFRRETFMRVGLFDERLGAGAAGCSEDSELWYRILADGGSCLYEPRAVVHHHHRPDWGGLEEQMQAYMRGHVAALGAQYLRYRHRGNLRRIGLQLPQYFLRVALRALRDGSSDHMRLLLPQVRGWWGGLTLVLRPGWRRSHAVPQLSDHGDPLVRRSSQSRSPVRRPVTTSLGERSEQSA